MPNSPRMSWPYPAENQDPWFDSFQEMVSQQDASAYAAREDRQLVMAGGGNFSFDAGANSLSWSATFEILSPVTGFRLSMAAGSVTMEDGQALYVNLVRAPTQNVTVTPQVAGQVPSTDVAYVIAVRRGSIVYFRHGLALSDGDSLQLFAGGSGSASGALIWMGGRETYDSNAAPLVTGAAAFTPTTHAPISSLTFRAVAANGNTGLTNYVQLYNVTDGELVAQLEFTSTEITKDEVALVLGSGAGEIDDPEHIYEVRIVLGSAPAGPDDTIELYSAELRVL